MYKTYSVQKRQSCPTGQLCTKRTLYESTIVAELGGGMEKINVNHIYNKMIQDKQSFNFNSELLMLVNGNTDAAVLLSYCKQRQRMGNGNQKLDADLFWLGSHLASVIGLTRRRMDSARSILRKTGVLSERRSWQSRLEFHVDLVHLDKQLALPTQETESPASEEIPMNQEILNFAGKNLHAALMLSYAMIRQKEANKTLSADVFGIYWPMQQKQWYRLLGLKRHKQESARKVLRETGCCKERQWGWPARNEFHLDLDRLMTSAPRIVNVATGV